MESKLESTHLQQLMDQDACLVNHCQVQRAPVLEEGHIEQLIIYREVVVLCVVVGSCRRARL